MRAVPSVNQHLVVGVGLPLYLFGAVSSWGLSFAAGRHKGVSITLVSPTNQQGAFGAVCNQVWTFTVPVRYGRSNVSVIESGVPRKQNDASVAKHTVEKQLWTAQQQGERG